MKFYKRDPDRALAGMVELTLKQRGAYNSIIDLLYSRDGDVPDDDARVSRMIACHWREWAAVKADLIRLGKIWVEDGYLHARRVQETIKEAADFSQDQSKRASRGWQKRKKDKDINSGVMPSGNASTPTATPTPTVKEKRVGKPTPKKGNRLDDNWTLPKAWGDWAVGQGLPADRIRREALKFRNYWTAKSGQAATKINWERTWQNWCIKALEDNRPKRTNANDLSDRRTEMARRRDERAEAERAVAGGADRGDVVALLPAQPIGQNQPDG